MLGIPLLTATECKGIPKGDRKESGRFERIVWLAEGRQVVFAYHRKIWRPRATFGGLTGTIKYKTLLDKTFLGTYDLSTGDLKILRAYKHPKSYNYATPFDIGGAAYPFILVRERYNAESRPSRSAYRYYLYNVQTGKQREVDIDGVLSRYERKVDGVADLANSAGGLLVVAKPLMIGLTPDAIERHEPWLISVDGSAVRIAARVGYQVYDYRLFVIDDLSNAPTGCSSADDVAGPDGVYIMVNLESRQRQCFKTYAEFDQARKLAAERRGPTVDGNQEAIIVTRDADGAPERELIPFPFSRLR